MFLARSLRPSFRLLMLLGAFTLPLAACTVEGGTTSPKEDTQSPVDVSLDAGASDAVGADAQGDAAVPEDSAATNDASPGDAGTTDAGTTDAAQDMAVDDMGAQDGSSPDTAAPDVSTEDTAIVEPPKGPVQKLCEATGGTWDPLSCGHWVCGSPPDCKALIPGCKCGDGSVFDGGVGCMETSKCDEISPQELCESTEGSWLLETCGDWECGTKPLCEAIIAGCNCGVEKLFDAEMGCYKSPTCQELEAPAPALCKETGGQWLPGTCGHWVCGEMPACKAIIPGCNCGKGMNFDLEGGCFVDPTCTPKPADGPEGLCLATGGEWEPDSCSMWDCGKAPAPCASPKGGCNCGEGSVMMKEHGCLPSTFCEGATMGEMCDTTGGIFYLDTCGHYICGVENTCEDPKPGCDCGSEELFFYKYGCLTTSQCGP